MPFVAAHFNELDSSSTLTSPSCHSATPGKPCVQNDSIAGGVQVSYLNKGMVQSCSCGADSTHLTLPIGTPQANRG